MKITLKRRVPVTYYAVQMSIFVSEKRPEILPILTAVQEADDRNYTLNDYLKRYLFTELPARFTENVIYELQLLGLVEKGRLTKVGKITLEKLEKTNEAMIPQEDTYEVQIIDDPLIPQVFINFKSLKTDLKSSLFPVDNNRNKQNNNNKQRMRKLPKFILNMSGSTFKTLEKKSRLVTIQNIQAKGEIVKKKSRFINLELEYEDKWTLIVNLGTFTTTLDLPDDFDGDAIINRLLQEISPSADINQWIIPQNPINLNDKEIKGFRKNFSLNNLRITAIGNFQQVLLDNVQIQPIDLDSAKIWAKKLLLLTITDYVNRKDLLDEWERSISLNQWLSVYNLVLPDLAELWGEVKFGSRKYWYLRAPDDMLLDEVLETD